jgi:glycosyltransferase involved in cell wall biosynthesis
MEKIMTVLFLYLGQSNTAYVYEMTHAMVKQDCNLICLLSENNAKNYRLFTDLEKKHNNLKVIFIKTYKTKLQFVIRTMNVFRFIGLAHLIKKMNVDYIYMPWISRWSSVLCFFIRNTNIITTIHDVDTHKGEGDIITDRLKTFNIKKSNKVIVLTQGFIPDVMNKYGFAKKDICWIPHANYNYFIFSKQGQCKTIYNKILFFGRIYEYKGIVVLLKAMQIIVKINSDIILRIAGNGKLSDREKELITELDQRIELINRTIPDDEVQNIFETTDFTILPYIEASQSGVILVSYGFKKPVIATSVGGLPEQILPSTGILVPPNDEVALAKAIIKLYENPEKIFQMGLDAYNYATNELTWDNSAKKLIEFIQT